jgi:hypothetical protein
MMYDVAADTYRKVVVVAMVVAGCVLLIITTTMLRTLITQFLNVT